jgi:hypothetical protein
MHWLDQRHGLIDGWPRLLECNISIDSPSDIVRGSRPVVTQMNEIGAFLNALGKTRDHERVTTFKGHFVFIMVHMVLMSNVA